LLVSVSFFTAPCSWHASIAQVHRQLFFAVAASVAFLPVTLGMTFGAVRATIQPQEFTVSTLKSDPQNALLSMLFLFRVVFLLASFGISGWMRSRGLGIALPVCLCSVRLLPSLRLGHFCMQGRHV